MTNQPPPLDAERVSDERLANMLAHHEKRQRERIPDIDAELGRLEYLYFADHIAALRELQRLRATQRESGGELEKAARAIVGDGFVVMVCGEDITKAHVPLYKINALRAALSASQRKECEACGGTKVVGNGGSMNYGEFVTLPCPDCTGQRKETP